jgi:hypothetical protein
MAAYALAFVAAIAAEFHLEFRHLLGIDGNHLGSGVFTGGVVGAAILCGGFYLFLRTGVRKPGFLVKSIGIALAAGILGIVGRAAGESLLRDSWLGIQAHQVDEDSWVLLIIWQTGMASMLGFVLLRDARPTLAAGESFRHKPARMREVAWLAALVAVIVSGYLVTEHIRGEALERRSLASLQAWELSEMPSRTNLPRVMRLPVDQVLLLTSIAGHSCEPDAGSNWSARPAGAWGPRSFIYWASYGTSESSADYLFAKVTVMQFPDAAWAKYAAKSIPVMDKITRDVPYVSTITEFGNQIQMNKSAREPGGGGVLAYYWTSGNLFVEVVFEKPEIDEEFLKDYLRLHPSSL